MRRLRDNAELLALAEPCEPDSIRIVGDARERGIGRDVHAWVVEEGGVPLGVVVVARLCSDRWYASPLLFDEAGAPALAAIVERSRARELGGPTEHVAALLPHVPRAMQPGRLPFIVSTEEHSPSEIETDPRVRFATSADLDQLVSVYSEFELLRIPTRPRLRRYLERTLRDRIVMVIEVDGAMASASLLEFRASAWDMWSSTTILPAYRGTGLYFSIFNAELKLTRETGRRNCFTLSRLNKVPLDRQIGQLGPATLVREWTTAPLRPRRLPGEKLARAVIARVEGPLTPRRPLER